MNKTLEDAYKAALNVIIFIIILFLFWKLDKNLNN